MSVMQLNSTLLISSMIAVLIPAAFNSAVQPSNFNGIDPLTNAQEGHNILSISRGVRGDFPGKLPYEADSLSRLRSSYFSFIYAT